MTRIPAIGYAAMGLVLATAAFRSPQRESHGTPTTTANSPSILAELVADDRLSLNQHPISSVADEMQYGTTYCSTIQQLNEIAEDLEERELSQDAVLIRTTCDKLRERANVLPWHIEPVRWEDQRIVIGRMYVGFGR